MLSRLQKLAIPMLLGLCIMFSGCASMRYTLNYDNYIEQNLQSYQYSDVRLSDAMAVARSILFEHGYQTNPVTNRNSLETEWGRTDSNTFRRYLVTGYNNANGTVIQFRYIEETSSRPGMSVNQSSQRDFTMEAELMRRLAPQDWNRISSEAKSYADSMAQK